MHLRKIGRLEPIRVMHIAQPEQAVKRGDVLGQAARHACGILQINTAGNYSRFGCRSAEKRRRTGQLVAVVKEKTPYTGEDRADGISGESIKHQLHFF